MRYKIRLILFICVPGLRAFDCAYFYAQSNHHAHFNAQSNHFFSPFFQHKTTNNQPEMDKGNTWSGVLLSQSVVLQIHDVIAQRVNLHVEAISGADSSVCNDITMDLSSKDVKIDLRDVAKDKNCSVTDGGLSDTSFNKKSLEAKAVEDGKKDNQQSTKFNMVRFQFNGKDIITIQWQDKLWGKSVIVLFIHCYGRIQAGSNDCIS